MAHTYEFTQYNDPGLARSGGIRNRWSFTSDVTTYMDQYGNLFAPAIIAHDALTLSQERSSGQTYVRVPRDFVVAQLFRTGTPARTIWLDIRDQDTGALSYVGRVRNTSFLEAEARLLLSSIQDMLQREGLRTHWQGSCEWPLYGRRCTIDRNAVDAQGAYKHRVDGLLAAVSVNGLTLTCPAFATRPNGVFEAGLLEIDGQSRMVSTHSGDTVTLLVPIDGLQVGAPLSVYKGCNRSTGAGGCADFGNVLNFSGCPNINKKNIFVNGVEE